MPGRKDPEDRYRQLVEFAPHAILVVDRTGVIQLVNSRLLTWFGYSREEMLGKPVEILIPERFRIKHPGFLVSFMGNPSLRAMGTGRDLYARRKDGSEFPIGISLSPIETNDGLQVIAAIADMTERQRAEITVQRSAPGLGNADGESEAFKSKLATERELRASQRLLQTVFDTFPYSTVVKDRQGRYLM